MNKKIRKSIPAKSKRLLQKEINSECPFCKNQDVDHFEIHHIDENPSNNLLSNLLMLCPLCHSKITKGDITKREVKSVKENLSISKSSVEFVSVIVDRQSCSWKLSDENERAFYYENDDSLNSCLVLNWSFINHLNKTLILKSVKYTAISLPSGISGFPKASVLKSLVKYGIPVRSDEGEQVVNFLNQIQIPAKQGFLFETELFYYGMEKEKYPIKYRAYIDFEFEFSDNQKVKIPRLFLNCISENERMKIYYVG